MCASKNTNRDKKSGYEKRGDLEVELTEIDFSRIERLRDGVRNLYSLETDDEENRERIKSEIDDVLTKYLNTYEKFEKFNSAESRNLYFKKQELALEASHDWSEKCRLFLFRILGSVLLVVTLFGIGYIESEFDWANLPMTKYLSAAQKIP